MSPNAVLRIAELKRAPGPALAPFATEHQEQERVVDWWAYACRRHKLPEHLLFAIPNAGKRSRMAGGLLKAEGLRPGIPDLMLAVPRDGFGGLFIEMKALGKVARPEQRQVLADLARQRFCTVVCQGADAAIAEIRAYLEAT